MKCSSRPCSLRPRPRHGIASPASSALALLGALAAGCVTQGSHREIVAERDQLLVDLEAERSRVRRLKAANDEVSGRLEAMTGTLKDMMPVSG